ncbi:tRNA (adenosine(37)-N6)-dimethylallyltransferase MiaA [Legionella jordanis]|uniref:tRNA dimethylallyltransferase n=1 Tax=Legionella jordanis TaxID=456 RepID=A0A0W0VBN1_9GAMM|nr:tRNA (adenosine(37)-N6)-dimethylallyltransferase MiaA [Legionella jordanis]KTD17527.1 tRNA delta(2)-isopentenylpyrophosphate transferase [Legionella jordanis]RMX05135.1 tRNA (adenosine(37)-N6)-dimethylallyltransferase MiaA [Legionella jordanis]RMX17391.1 tRNA (adenosine(37)-N6)-dimethylallyltransferase MiaA [Legionella jordanis]VEH13496.1 tRNA delta(2)-isopentenylpyrophosphate transferase [Legionella jordanis]HAT8714413.1 tRNA (adenosine(37)-N6)-dimethylallyltransferase MiaA [Legionella jor
MTNTVFCLMGPTASGKTALATELIKHFPLEIISVDSAMIYKEMSIGTAKPSPQELKETPHHLIDIIEPSESYSAAEFCEDAIELIEAIFERKKYPLLVGGTMMYFNALQQGLSTLPQADELIRAELLRQAERHGWSYLHEQLNQVDPESANRIHPNDTQRIQRALEVYQITGKPLSYFWNEQKGAGKYHFINLILFPQRREWLHERIALRFEQMLAKDFVGEVAQLLQKWQLPPTSPSMKSVGYRQVINYLAGDYNYDTLRQKGVAATRQLAKRQLTWLRTWPQGIYFDCEDFTDTKEKIVALMQKILDNSTPIPN